MPELCCQKELSLQAKLSSIGSLGNATSRQVPEGKTVRQKLSAWLGAPTNAWTYKSVSVGVEVAQCRLLLYAEYDDLMPAVVHEGLQGYQPCINQPWHLGPLGRALP